MSSIISVFELLTGPDQIVQINKIVIAYEPVWAIGTGVIPKIEDLKMQIYKIRKIIKKEFKKQNPKTCA